MPQLPAKPNLEHLKHQSKDLLKDYLAHNADVTSRIQKHILGFTSSSRFLLADAQTVIAREHDFPSWKKLKLYVEALGEPTQKTKAPQLSVRKLFIQDLVSQLLTWSKKHESEQLGQRFTIMPLRDILSLREVVIANHQHSLLVDGLLEGLKHAKPRVRYNCAIALDHLADERCTQPLLQLLNDSVPRVRRAAVHSLSCDACKVLALPDKNDLTDILIRHSST